MLFYIAIKAEINVVRVNFFSCAASGCKYGLDIWCTTLGTIDKDSLPTSDDLHSSQAL